MSDSLHALSPIDGRYFAATSDLRVYFSEAALFRYRLIVEIEYFIELSKDGFPLERKLTAEQIATLRSLYADFSDADAVRIKEIEKTTNHDVKAVEYFIKEVFDNKSLKEIYSNLIEQQELFNKPISVYIVNFQKENSKKKCENLLQNVKDELYYNSMHYVASLDFTESEFQDKEKLQKSILEQLVSLLQRRLIKINEDDTTTKCIINEDESDEVYKYVKDFVGVLLEDVNSKQELEDKFKAAQKAAIKELLNGEFSVYYDEDDEEAQYEIQRLYNYSFPELLEGLQYKYVADDNLKGKPAIMHYVYYSVGAQAQTDLSFLSEYFSNEQNRKRLLVILERITEMIRPSEKSELGLGDAKKERDAIQGLKKKGEIDELDVKFLETFINCKVIRK
jgi:hypothetical protein